METIKPHWQKVSRGRVTFELGGRRDSKVKNFSAMSSRRQRSRTICSTLSNWRVIWVRLVQRDGSLLALFCCGGHGTLCWWWLSKPPFMWPVTTVDRLNGVTLQGAKSLGTTPSPELELCTSWGRIWAMGKASRASSCEPGAGDIEGLAPSRCSVESLRRATTLALLLTACPPPGLQSPAKLEKWPNLAASGTGSDFTESKAVSGTVATGSWTCMRDMELIEGLVMLG